MVLIFPAEGDRHKALKVCKILCCTFGPVKLIKEKSIKISLSDSSSVTGVWLDSWYMVDTARCIIAVAVSSRKLEDDEL